MKKKALLKFLLNVLGYSAMTTSALTLVYIFFTIDTVGIISMWDVFIWEHNLAMRLLETSWFSYGLAYSSYVFYQILMKDVDSLHGKGDVAIGIKDASQQQK